MELNGRCIYTIGATHICAVVPVQWWACESPLAAAVSCEVCVYPEDSHYLSAVCSALQSPALWTVAA